MTQDILTSNSCKVNCGLEGKESDSASDGGTHSYSQRDLPDDPCSPEFQTPGTAVHPNHEAQSECEDAEHDEIPGSFSHQF